MTIRVVKDPAGQISHFVASYTDISARKQAEAQANQLAFYDVLTRLANRTLLLELLQRAQQTRQREQHCGALLLLDLDDFKALNDSLGFECGDQLLQSVAARLQQ